MCVALVSATRRGIVGFSNCSSFHYLFSLVIIPYTRCQFKIIVMDLSGTRADFHRPLPSLAHKIVQVRGENRRQLINGWNLANTLMA